MGRNAGACNPGEILASEWKGGHGDLVDGYTSVLIFTLMRVGLLSRRGTTTKWKFGVHCPHTVHANKSRSSCASCFSHNLAICAGRDPHTDITKRKLKPGKGTSALVATEIANLQQREKLWEKLVLFSSAVSSPKPKSCAFW